jgi:hydroxypyruvate isomerase
MLSFAANISLLFQEWELADRFAAARDAGFTAVEIQFPYVADADVLGRARQLSGMEIILINGPRLSPDHPAGSAGRPEQVAAFRESLGRVREYADALGVKQVNFLAGTLDAGNDRDVFEEVLCTNLAAAAEALSADGVSVLLEAINPHDVPGYLVDSFEVARRILKRIPNAARLQLDLYHLARMGRTLAELLDGWDLPIAHVQFADAPGRHEPGTGSLALGDDLDRLVSWGYTGWVAAEYLPSATTTAGLGWLSRWQERYGAIPYAI